MTPKDTITGRRAVQEFVDWLYEHGPDANSMRRERLLSLYYRQKAEKTMTESVPRYVPADNLLPLLRREE